MDKCDTCILRYNCESSQEYYCKHNNYLEYDGPENLTNYDRFMKCTPEQLASAFYNLKETAVYTEGRLLNIEDNPNDFLKWLKAKSNLLDPEIFEMRMKKASLVRFDGEGSATIDVEVPFWYGDKEIIPLFKEKLGVEYSPNNCTVVYWS